MTLFLAGHETTANALNWTWYLLAHYPEVEAKLHAEIDAVLGGRPATLDDLKRLPYTAQVIKESMRLYPPAWNVPARPSKTSRSAATRSKQAVWSSCRSSSFSVTRAGMLLRTCSGRSAGRKTSSRLPRFAYLPFGGGPRICIGNSFAQMEANLLLATIAGRYRCGWWSRISM